MNDGVLRPRDGDYGKRNLWRRPPRYESRSLLEIDGGMLAQNLAYLPRGDKDSVKTGAVSGQP